MTLLDLTPRPPAGDALDALPVVVIGAGPVGLAAAAQLHARGIAFTVLEAAPEVGAGVRAWGHVRLFSPWRHLIDPAARALLARTDWTAPADDEAPTGDELVSAYLQPLAALPALAGSIRTGARVTRVGRLGLDRTRSDGRATTPFTITLQTQGPADPPLLARAVIDASGTTSTPSPLSADGLPLPGADAVADLLLPPLPDVAGADAARVRGRHVTVVGAGHSAANTVLALLALEASQPSGIRVSWLIRRTDATQLTGSDGDELAGRARLGRRMRDAVAAREVELIDAFAITRAERVDDTVVLHGTRRGEAASHTSDVVVAATGFRPDLDALAELRLDLDEIVQAPRRLAPLIDPNVHSCGTVEPHGVNELRHPEPNLFVVGMESYGRAPTFLLATGFEQVRSVVAWLAGDLAAAARVELSLPATGVCSTDAGDTGCCA